MIELKRCAADHPDFVSLITALDAELWSRYPETQHNYTAANTVPADVRAVLAYVDGTPAASGCFKVLDPQTVELKRMYVLPQYRRQGLSSLVLSHLMAWAKAQGHTLMLLQTGVRQPEAVALYAKMGFEVIENYGPYINDDNSICMLRGLGPDDSGVSSPGKPKPCR